MSTSTVLITVILPVAMISGQKNRSFIVQKGESLLLACHVTKLATNDASTNSDATPYMGGQSLRWISEADVFTKSKFVSSYLPLQNY
jgi:hypothetical protein